MEDGITNEILNGRNREERLAIGMNRLGCIAFGVLIGGLLADSPEVAIGGTAAAGICAVSSLYYDHQRLRLFEDNMRNYSKTQENEEKY